MLQVLNLSVTVISDTSNSRQQILHQLSLELSPGELLAVMGPNGSGKSTLAYTLAGHPQYQVTGGEIKLDDQSLLPLSPDQRASAGLFLGFQYPVEVAGVRVQNFLRVAHQARFATQPAKQFARAIDFRQHLQSLATELEIAPELLSRGLNEGFSGGEKKRLEVLQLLVLEPKYAILDESDSGLDVDAIKAVAKGIRLAIERFQTGIMLITHYQRILEFVSPDRVAVLQAGRISLTGDRSLAMKIDQGGYRTLSETKPPFVPERDFLDKL